MKSGWIPVLLFLSFLAAVSAQEDGDATLRLSVGDPKTRGRLVEVSPGAIVSGKTGRPVSEEALFRDLRRADFIYVGETHNSLPMHDIQLRVLTALIRADARETVIGLEMFPASSQPVLDRWSAGELEEEEFLRESRWYVHWNFHWGFYREIFELARDNGISVFGLNVAREVITKVRMKGWTSLSEEEKALVPEPDLSNEDHRTLMRTVFSSEDMPHQMKGEGFEAVFEGLYRSQSAWDEVMALNAVRASPDGKRRVIVLAGSGHLIYNLGINRRAFQRNGRPFRTVVCVTVPKGRPSVKVSRSLADYVWGLAEEERPAFPSVGLRFKSFDGLANLVVEAKPVDGVALGQDFEKGDVILSVDGKTFSDPNDVRMHLASCPWGGQAVFRLLRAGQEKTVVLKFEQPAPPGADGKEGKEP